MIKVKDGYAKLIGTTYQGSATQVLLSNGGDLEYSASSKASTLVQRNASQHIYATYFNSAISDEALTDIGSVYVRNTSDTFIRRVSKTQFYSILDDKFVTLDTTQSITGAKTFSTSVRFANNASIIQNQNDTSNYTIILKWYKNGASRNTYDPSIGQHNTGGDGNGSICILPYPTATSPWNGTVGLFISKGVLKLDGKSIALAENYYTKTESDERYVNVTGDTMTGPLIVKATITGTQLISTIATGTSPLKVTSTTVVTNLNSDLLDGLHETSFFRARGDQSIASSVPTTTELASNNNLCGSWNVKYTGASGHLVQFNTGSGSTRYMQFYSTYSGSLYWRNSTDSTLNTKSWKTIVDSANYTGIVLKIGTATKGSATLPIYLNAGTPTACSTTLGVSITGNAATATKLQTARTINGTSFDGTANIVTAYWGTARTISLSGAVTGSASVNGSQNVTIATTYQFGSIDGRYVGGNKTANHGSCGKAYTADTYSSTFVNKAFVAFAERGSWAYADNGYVSTDTGVNIPLAGTAIFQWGASDTSKTQLYITPHNTSGVSNPAANEMLFYTSNGSGYISAWTRVLTHRNYTNYTVTKTGGGASGTWGISITGNAATASILKSSGNKSAISGTTLGDSGLRLYQVYSNGYPATYGNLLNIGGLGYGELLCEWKGDTSPGHLYYRSKRDVVETAWSQWVTVLDSSNYSSLIGNNYWKVNKQTTTGTGDIYLEMWRGVNASWKILNSGGNLYFQSNYTTTAGSYFNVLTLQYNSGNAVLRGMLTAKAHFVNTGDSTLKIYSGRTVDGQNDGCIAFQTSIDGTDGQSHAYPTQYGNRCTIALQPRGGQVMIGATPSGVNTGHKLYVQGESRINGVLTVSSTVYNKQLVIESTGSTGKNMGGGIWFRSATDRNQELVLRHEWYDTFAAGYGFAISRHDSLEAGDASMFLYNTGRYISKAPAGTKPIDVVSTTLCNNLNADLLDGYHSGSFESYQLVVIDASGLNNNTWYPVTMSIGNSLQTRIRIEGDTSANASWNSRGDKHMALILDYTVNGSSWGWTDVSRAIHRYTEGAGTSSCLRGLGQLTNSSTEYVFVRGGAKYNFYVSRFIVPTLRTSTYTSISQSVSPTTTAPAAIATPSLTFSAGKFSALTYYPITGRSTVNIPTNTSHLTNDSGFWTGTRYWANIAVSTASSTSTQPTFNTCYTSNWFRSTGSTGWYSQTYRGGWHMSDSTWLRAYNGKAVYTSNAGSQAFNAAGGFYSSGSGGNGLTIIGSESTTTRIKGQIGSSVNATVARYEVQWYSDYARFDVHRGSSTNISKWSFKYNSTEVTYLTTGGHLYANGFHHRSMDSNSYVLLAGGSYKALTDFAKGNAGSATKGVYVTGGTVTAMTYSLSANLNSGTAGKLATYSSGTTVAAYNSTVGASNRGIYMSSGVPTVMTYYLNSTVNSGTSGKLAYYSGATTVASYGSTVGSKHQPVYMNAGVPTICSYYSFLGASQQPVVLVTGYFYRSRSSSTSWYFSGYKHSQIGSPSFYVRGGVMRLQFSNTTSIMFSSACAQGRRNFSGSDTSATQAYDGSNGNYGWRSEGAYWFNSYVSNSGRTSYLYIRAYRLANSYNDSWYTGDSCWKNEQDAIESVAFTVFGYIYH